MTIALELVMDDGQTRRIEATCTAVELALPDLLIERVVGPMVYGLANWDQIHHRSLQPQEGAEA